MTGPARAAVRPTAARAMSLAWRAAPAHVVGYVALTLLGGLTPLAAAWLTKLVIDGLADGTTPWGALVPAAASLGAVGLVAATLPEIGRYLRAETGRRVGLAATEGLYAAVDRFVGLERFEDPAFQDRLQLARSSSVTGPGSLIDSGLGAVRAVVTLAGFAGALFLTGPWVAAAVLAAAVPALFAELGLSRRRATALTSTGHAERREMFYSGLLLDAPAAKEVRLFGSGPYLWRRMAAEMRSIDRAHRRVDRREVAVQSGLGLLGALVAGGALLWAVRAAAAGRLSVGDVALVVASVGSVQAALAQLARDIAGAHEALLLFGHYVAVLDAGPDLPVRSDPVPDRALTRGVELRDVWFRYAEDQPWVLRGVDLVLPAGRATALVGLNGAGKTTLVKLLCRLYDPTRGAILWDGIDLRELDPAALRRRIRTVFQDAVGYDLTAAENIAIGDLTAVDDRPRIEAAARAAGVHGVLDRLPAGYDTMLSRMFFSDSDRDDPETGVVLSGGQWQRLAIARGLVLDRPDLLILDEPSSSLDPEAEHDVHSRLRAGRAGRTSLLVSHRLGAVRDADLIVVLADGRIAERGSHDDLLRTGGAYARLFALQASGYRSEPAEAVG
jgi:ATP-binding cassette, subfamily B, bacterial